MKRNCQIQGVDSIVEIRSEEPGEISVIIGTTGRVVRGAAFTLAVQNSRNVGFDPQPDLSVTCDVKETGDRVSSVLLKNSITDSTKVILCIGELSEEVSATNLLDAVGMCSRTI